MSKLILTKRKSIELHREEWGWIAKHPLCTKKHWPRWTINGGDIPAVRHLCFLCEYAGRKHSRIPGHVNSMCFYCPLDWSPAFNCFDEKALFARYVRSQTQGDGPEASRFAAMIRDLPEKK